jgi:hypothetical protein
MMTLTTSTLLTPGASERAYLQHQVDRAVDSLISSLPEPGRLSADQRRGIIARYTAVLEGNFIYWMTGAYLAVRSEESRRIILDNLHEEVRDCHPGMLRKFALSANALPRDYDAQAVYQDLTNVRLFIGRLSAVPLVLTMAFFEGFIQKFMDFLAKVAIEQGSAELEYTDVHGVCDVAHTEGLFRALDAEMAINPPRPGTDLFEGVDLLTSLIKSIVPPTAKHHGLNCHACALRLESAEV